MSECCLIRSGGQNQISVTKVNRQYLQDISIEICCSLKETFLSNLDIHASTAVQHRRVLRVHSWTKCEQSSHPVTVTQAGAINTAMIGHQISPLSQQIIAVSVVRSGEREGEEEWGGGGLERKKKNQFRCPKACNKALLPRQLVFLGSEAALVRPVISGTVIQLPTFSCVNF